MNMRGLYDEINELEEMLLISIGRDNNSLVTANCYNHRYYCPLREHDWFEITGHFFRMHSHNALVYFLIGDQKEMRAIDMYKAMCQLFQLENKLVRR